MKKNEMISKLTEIRELNKADMVKEIDQMLIDLGPKQKAAGTKIERFVELGERTMDPAMKYPRQMIVCYDLIAAEVKVGEKVSRARILELIGQGAEALATRQSPERIYGFYQKTMEENGWLKREAVKAEA